MRPTIENAKKWSPLDLCERGAYAGRLAETVRDDRKILSDGLEALLSGWDGWAAEQAAVHAEAEMKGASIVADDLADLGRVLEEAGRAIDDALQVALRAISAAE